VRPRNCGFRTTTCPVRIVIARRFQALIVVRVNTNAMSSCSLKCARVRSKNWREQRGWNSWVITGALGIETLLLTKFHR